MLFAHKTKNKKSLTDILLFIVLQNTYNLQVKSIVIFIVPCHCCKKCKLVNVTNIQEEVWDFMKIS